MTDVGTVSRPVNFVFIPISQSQLEHAQRVLSPRAWHTGLCGLRFSSWTAQD